MNSRILERIYGSRSRAVTQLQRERRCSVSGCKYPHIAHHIRSTHISKLGTGMSGTVCSLQSTVCTVGLQYRFEISFGTTFSSRSRSVRSVGRLSFRVRFAALDCQCSRRHSPETITQGVQRRRTRQSFGSDSEVQGSFTIALIRWLSDLGPTCPLSSAQQLKGPLSPYTLYTVPLTGLLSSGVRAQGLGSRV